MQEGESFGRAPVPAERRIVTSNANAKKPFSPADDRSGFETNYVSISMCTKEQLNLFKNSLLFWYFDIAMAAIRSLPDLRPVIRTVTILLFSKKNHIRRPV